MAINFFRRNSDNPPELNRSKVQELIHNQAEKSHSELANLLKQNLPKQAAKTMQNSPSNDFQTLPQAAQQQNAKRDRATYIDGAHGVDAALHQASQGISNAHTALDRAYKNATPEQRKALESLEHPLHTAQGDVHLARGRLVEATPVKKTEHNATLAKNGQSQFNAAARGDPRSTEVQIANQNRPAQKPEVVTISASPGEGRDTPLEQQRGQAKGGFNQAIEGKTTEATPRPEVASEQVKNTNPEPQLKPSSELGAGVDATVHLQAKSKDNQLSRQASEKYSQANATKPSPELQAHYQNLAAKLNQQTTPSQGQNHSVGTSQGR